MGNMKRITLTITVETSLTPGEAFHAVADALNDHRFGEIIEGRAFFADDHNGAAQAEFAHDMMVVRGSVESTVTDGESVGFSARRKGGR